MNKTNQPEPKYSFNEVVQVTLSEHYDLEILHKKGYIAGRAINDSDVWTYGVFLFDYEEVWSFDEEDLKSTGEFYELNKKCGTIKVYVNDKDEGELRKTFTSLLQIKNEIINGSTYIVNGYMFEVGMLCDNTEDIYRIMKLCITHNDPLIRMAGFTALWHFIKRFNNDIIWSHAINMIKTGITDNNNDIKDMMNFILEEIHTLAPNQWDNITKNI